MTLTIALAILGAAVLLGLLAQAWWNARKTRPRQVSPSLPPAERVEPALDASGPDLAGEPSAWRTLNREVPRIDALIDAIVPLALEAPVTGEFTLQHLPPSRRAGSKPFYVEGLDTETGTWSPSARVGATVNCRPVCSWPTAAAP